MSRLTTYSLRVAAVLAAFALAAAIGGPARAHEGHGKPALIQVGDCDALGAAAFTLIGVGAEEDADGLPIAPPAPVGPETAGEVSTSTSTVATTVDQIVDGGHAIVVYASDEEMDTPIACGAAGGIQVGDDLVMSLAPVGDEGQSGIALLRTAGTESTVTIFLTAGAAHDHDEAEEDHGHEEDEAGHSHDEEATPDASPEA